MMKRKKTSIKNYITYAIALGAFAVMMLLIATGNATRHLQSMLVPICINIVLAASLNLVVGVLGELSLGHAGFMSVGAYAGCLFSLYMQEILPTAVRFPLAMLVGGIVAAAFGVLVGVPVLRLKGDYLAIVTLAFGEIIRSVIINLNFTGGAAGLKGTPQDATFPAAFVVVMITLVVILNLVNSKQGRAIMSLRDNTIAAESCGIHVSYYKLLAFVVAAFFAGVAGALYGHNYSILTAGTFDYNKTIEILVIVVLGGMGNIRGSIISTVILYILPEMLRGLEDFRMLIYAIVLIAVMLVTNSDRVRQMRDRLAAKRQSRKEKAEAEKGGSAA